MNAKESQRLAGKGNGESSWEKSSAYQGEEHVYSYYRVTRFDSSGSSNECVTRYHTSKSKSMSMSMSMYEYTYDICNSVYMILY